LQTRANHSAKKFPGAPEKQFVILSAAKLPSEATVCHPLGIGWPHRSGFFAALRMTEGETIGSKQCSRHVLFALCNATVNIFIFA
jgi:hypothetical protein